MKAVQLTHIGSPLEQRKVDVPTLGPGELLVAVKAAGICRSDLHYRGGASEVGVLPITLGHEVAGVVVDSAPDVPEGIVGRRVCLHYLCTCGRCRSCMSSNEQFCADAQMIGKQRDGGFAEFIAVAEASVLAIPDTLAFDHAAVMMCSSATAAHALRKARLSAGERVAVIGTGGLGMSAVQIAFAMGALEVYAVDIDGERLGIAAEYGAIPVDVAAASRAGDEGAAAAQVREATGGDGVDVAVELVGLPETIRTAVGSLAPCGRAAVAGIGDTPTHFHVYREFVGSERELIGVSDHRKRDLEYLIALAGSGRLSLDRIVTERIPLDAAAINARLDQMETFGSGIRTVVTP